MKYLRYGLRLGHLLISVLFMGCALALIGLALVQLGTGLQWPLAAVAFRARLNAVLDGIALLTVAVATLELAQTLLEEEVQRTAQMSTPTRVRRFLSRFMIVLVVSLSIESLVVVFRVSHEQPEQLPYAAAIGMVAAALLLAWGVFVRLNRSAEELEPEAMAQAKQEDEKLQSEDRALPP
jgi:hypothetical protein